MAIRSTSSLTTTAWSAALAYEYIPYDGPIVERQFAVENKLSRFFTGRNCKYGHLAERNTCDQRCCECAKIKCRKYYKENKDLCNFRTKRSRHKNPAPHRLQLKIQKGKRKSAEGTYCAKDISALERHQKWKCANCQCSIKKKYHIDHIMPLALGGTNWPKNLALLCPPCNLSKGAKHPDVWAQENGRLF